MLLLFTRLSPSSSASNCNIAMTAILLFKAPPCSSLFSSQLGCICRGYSPQHKGKKPPWSALWGPLLLHQDDRVSLHCIHRVKSSNSIKYPFIHITMHWSHLRHHTKVTPAFYFLDWPSYNWRGWMTARRAGLISTVSIGCSAAKRLPYQVLCHHGSLIVLDSDRIKCVCMQSCRSFPISG